MKKYLLAGCAMLAFGLTSAAQAETFNVGDPNFQLTNGSTPFTPSITAIFSNSFDASGSFDDTFEFTIPQNGKGSGFVGTSFSSNLNKLVIEELYINGVFYSVPFTGSGYLRSVGNIPITSGVLNTIRVVGTVTGSGDYTGNATFTAAIPEPGTWALMILGFATIGASMRSRRTKISFA